MRVTAYKLMKIDACGRLHFPFADTERIVRLGEWMTADDVSSVDGNGIRRTMLVFRGGSKSWAAPRPGFHCSDIPYASHIGIGGTRQQRLFIGNEDVWCECTMMANVDYQAEADANGRTKNGRINRQKADIRDHVPVDGFYRYKTNPAMRGTWLIGGAIRIDRIMYDDEVVSFALSNGLIPMPPASGERSREWTNNLNAINRIL